MPTVIDLKELSTARAGEKPIDWHVQISRTTLSRIGLIRQLLLHFVVRLPARRY
jgi:hypothetical protein